MFGPFYEEVKLSSSVPKTFWLSFQNKLMSRLLLRLLTWTFRVYGVLPFSCCLSCDATGVWRSKLVCLISDVGSVLSATVQSCGSASHALGCHFVMMAGCDNGGNMLSSEHLENTPRTCPLMMMMDFFCALLASVFAGFTCLTSPLCF